MTGIGHVAEITPLLPIHILWINLVTDSLPALALAEDEGARNIMKRKPNRSSSIFTKDVVTAITYQGILIGILTFIAFIAGIVTAQGEWAVKLSIGQTMAFLTLTFAELFHVFNVRSNKDSMFYKGMFKNKLLLFAVIFNVCLTLGVIFITPIREMFKLSMMTKGQMMIIFGLAIVPNIVSETVKFVKKALNEKLDMAKMAVRVINSKIKVYEKINGKKALNKEWYSLLGEVDRIGFSTAPVEVGFFDKQYKWINENVSGVTTVLKTWENITGEYKLKKILFEGNISEKNWKKLEQARTDYEKNL